MVEDKTSVVNFITRSKFFGTYYNSIQTMDGFGVYTFPDQTEYRGYFQRGLFHGFGCITIFSPSKMLIKGQFVHGKLYKVEDMTFADGLNIDCSYDRDFFNEKNWQYCTRLDRRYTTEISKGLEPVSPYAHLTLAKPPTTLQPMEYDTEAAVFNASSGFLFFERLNEIRSVYVNCLKEKNWIRKHCRRGAAIHLPEELLCEFEKEILKNNLDAENYYESCPCNKKLEAKKVMSRQTEQIENDDKATSIVSGVTLSSSSVQSLKDNSLFEDTNAFCQELREQVAVLPVKKVHKPKKNIRIFEPISQEPTRLSELWKMKLQ